MTRCLLFCSVGRKPKIPKEPQLYFGTENFEQFRFQSIQVPIPKLQVPPNLEPNWSRNGAEIEPKQYQNETNENISLKTLYRNPGFRGTIPTLLFLDITFFPQTNKRVFQDTNMNMYLISQSNSVKIIIKIYNILHIESIIPQQ